MIRTKLLYITLDFNYTCGVSKNVLVNLKYLSKYSEYELYLIANKGDSLDRLNEISNLNVSLFKIEKDHKNIFKLINNLFSLYHYCKKNKIDIIHTHHRYTELLAVIVSKLYRVKTITTVHSFVCGFNKISFRSQMIITVSKAINSYLNNNYPHTKYNSQTLYNCVDKEFYDFVSNVKNISKTSLGFNENDKLLLFIGRDNKVKGLDILIEALNKKSSLNNVKLLVVGFDLTAIKSYFNPNIKIIGSQKDVRPFINLCDIVIIPSREDPFPYVMLETAAMKKAIIGSRTGGIAEFIEDGINGTLFESENTDQLADKIDFMFDNLAIANLMAEELYIKVKAECNCDKYFQILKKVYNEI
jgi:glycosyltransferase involved in cell wall biosynthesis